MRRELLGSPDPIDRTRFPVDEWAWRETWYSTDDLGQTETARRRSPRCRLRTRLPGDPGWTPSSPDHQITDGLRRPGCEP